MPRVPTTTQQVTPRGISGGELQTNIDFSGQVSALRNLANESSQTGQALASAFGQYQDIKNKYDEVQVQDADKKLSEALVEHQVMTNNYKGKEAAGAEYDVFDSWGKRVGEIEKDLANDNQKKMFKKSVDNRYLQLNRHLQFHTSNELRKYEDESTNEYVKSLQNEASANYRDLNAIAGSLDKQEMAIKKHAQRNGNGEEWVKNRIAESSTQTHSSIIKSLLADDDDVAASEYFKVVKDDLTKEGRDSLKQLIENGVLRGESQRRSDSIVAKGLSISESLDEARKIKDPKVRDETVRRVKDRYAEASHVQRMEQEKLYNQAAVLVESSKGTARINDNEWLALTLPQRQALEKRSMQLRTGEKPITDWDLYYKVKTLASIPEQRQKFLQMNIAELRPSLDDARFKEIVDLQIAARKGDAKSMKTLDGIQTNKQIVDGVIREMGLDPNEKGNKGFFGGSGKVERVNAFKRMVDLQVEQFQKEKGREATNEEIQQIARTQAIEVVTKRGFFTDTKKRIFELNPDEQVDLTFEDIPKEELNKIKTSIYRYNSTNQNKLPTDGSEFQKYALRLYSNKLSGVVDGRK